MFLAEAGCGDGCIGDGGADHRLVSLLPNSVVVGWCMPVIMLDGGDNALLVIDV